MAEGGRCVTCRWWKAPGLSWETPGVMDLWGLCKGMGLRRSRLAEASRPLKTRAGFGCVLHECVLHEERAKDGDGELTAAHHDAAYREAGGE